MADHGFQDWQEDYCPFDAIGFTAITSSPPSQADFDKAVRYARFVTDPARIARAGDAASRLPYSREQVDRAVAYLSGQQPTVDSRGRVLSSQTLDAVAWEWAFEELIGFQKLYLYSRSWAPHRLRWEHVLLDEPVVVDLTPNLATTSTKTTVSRVEPAQAPTSRLLSTTAAMFEPTTPARLARLRQSLPPQQTSQVSPELGSFGRTRQPFNLHTTRSRDRAPYLLLSSSPPAPRTSSTLLNTHPSDDDDDDDGNDDKASDPGSKIQHHKTQQQQHKRVFIGFHRAQVQRLPASQQTRQRDHRQAAYAHVDSLGRVQRLLDRHNVAGQMVPEEHRLARRGSSAVIASGDVLYLDELAALGSYADVNSRILEMMRGGGGDGEVDEDEERVVPAWVPTPKNNASLVMSREHGAKRSRST
ncbi:hypothetical protein MN608_05529 [Microdochium nivale]|nr:hypothetical protein MN608_05529 [Microdochium nivale]